MKTPPRSRGALQAQATTSPLAQRLLGAQPFVHTEQNAGLVLLFASVVAVVWANSPWRDAYATLFHTKLTFDLGVLALSEDLQHWINDGLMAIFFFVVGLEIKRELVHGELSSPRQAALPVAGALGGMVVPALLYLALNREGPGLRGWGVPMATDIAFALGVLALAGKRVPSELRLFLLTLAVVDDIGAILVIAVFYTDSLSVAALGIAVALLALIFVLGRVGLRNLSVYVFLGILVWLAVFESGVHATIAGVALGLLTPASPFLAPGTYARLAGEYLAEFRSSLGRNDHERAEAALGEIEELTVGTEATSERLLRLVHPWSSYLVLPLFALANAGVELSSDLLGRAVTSPVTTGIVLGLIVGKPLGILSASALSVFAGLARLPRNVGWRHLFGAGILAGIGFTVSLFIGDLAFTDEIVKAEAKLGIFVASIAAGLVGLVVLRVVSGAGSPPRRGRR